MPYIRIVTVALPCLLLACQNAGERESPQEDRVAGSGIEKSLVSTNDEPNSAPESLAIERDSATSNPPVVTAQGDASVDHAAASTPVVTVAPAADPFTIADGSVFHEGFVEVAVNEWLRNGAALCRERISFQRLSVLNLRSDGNRAEARVRMSGRWIAQRHSDGIPIPPMMFPPCAGFDPQRTDVQTVEQDFEFFLNDGKWQLERWDKNIPR